MNNPLSIPHYCSTWGESIAIGIQTLAICILILIYRDDFKQAVLFTGVYFVGMVVILLPSTPLWVHTYLAMLSVPLNVTSRVSDMNAFDTSSTFSIENIPVFPCGHLLLSPMSLLVGSGESL